MGSGGITEESHYQGALRVPSACGGRRARSNGIVASSRVLRHPRFSGLFTVGMEQQQSLQTTTTPASGESASAKSGNPGCRHVRSPVSHAPFCGSGPLRCRRRSSSRRTQRKDQKPTRKSRMLRMRNGTIAATPTRPRMYLNIVVTPINFAVDTVL